MPWHVSQKGLPEAAIKILIHYFIGEKIPVFVLKQTEILTF